MNIVGCGALNLDLIYEVEDICTIKVQEISLAPGREIFINFELAQKILPLLESKGHLIGKSGGGSAANTICALARLGHQCSFVSTVGDDEAGKFLLDSMEGVDCTHVEVQGRSSICLIIMDNIHKDRSMIVVPGDFWINTKKEAIRQLLNQADLLHMTSLVQDQGLAAQQELASLLGASALLSLDPGEIYSQRGYSPLKPLLDRTTLLFSSDYELKGIFGDLTPEQILTRGLVGQSAPRQISTRFNFFDGFPPPVIAKKAGSKGASLISESSKIERPASKVDKIIDNTGAGDAFNAGLLHGIFKGLSPEESLELAISLAAFSLKFPGRSWIEKIPSDIINSH